MMADRMLENIRKCSIPHRTSSAASCVTVSIGVTTSKVEHTHNGEEYIKRADEMLYKSKQGGRDRYTYETLLNKGFLHEWGGSP